MFWVMLFGFISLLGFACPVVGIILLLDRHRYAKTPITLARYLRPGKMTAVKGTALPWISFNALFSQKPGVYGEFRVQELVVEGTGKYKNVETVDLYEQKTTAPLVLKDNSGHVLVATDDARMDIPESFVFDNSSSITGRPTKPLPEHLVAFLLEKNIPLFDAKGAPRMFRFSEYLLAEGDPIFVFGYADDAKSTIAETLGKTPDGPRDRSVDLVITSGEKSRDQCYVSKGDQKQVSRKLLWQGLALIVIGPLVGVVSAVLAYAVYTH